MSKLLINILLKANLNEAFVDQSNQLQGLEGDDVPIFNMLSPDALKTLKDEYSRYYQPKFDWNQKQSELGNKMGDWLEANDNKGFKENINNLIHVTTQDLVTLKRKKLSQQKLDVFEELIIPSLGSEVLTPQLSKYLERALLDPNATAESIQKAYKEAENILDPSGSIDSSKVTQSDLFQGGDINYPAFEKYIQQHPEYKGVYDTWKKLFDENTQWVLKDLNAYRSSTPFHKIAKLNSELRQVKKHIK